MGRLLYGAYFLEVGLLLIVLPWSGFWERNYFAQTWSELLPFITNSFVRGGITGLGLVNLVAGVSQLAPLFSPRQSHEPAPPGHAPPYEPTADTRVEP